MRKFFKNNILTIIIVVATFGGIILFSVLPKPSLALSSGIVAIISAITGVLLTVLVTKSLLDKEYYARARNRHRYYGLTFEIYKSESQGRSVRFCVEIENDYYYGFDWGSEPQSDDRLSQIVKQVSSKYKSNQWWGGWRWPDYTDQDGRYHDLDFWKMKDNNAMRRLIDENQREKLIEDIAQEMNEQIRKFVEIAKKNNL
jgi:hypothetical protein